ncbi:MAG: endonuclease/exonuclease/phosphatase family protein [Bacteroidales bacterium]|nr:endonuclease/exonuclease/phosphatase family protein [Bacteroidales bacterium]
MKFKKLLTSALLLAVALTACTKKEEPFEQPEEVVPPQEEEGDFAYIFKIADETKTVFGTNHVVWEADDLVGSYASTSKNKSTPVTIDGSGGVHITIRSSVALAAGDMVYAYYPFSSTNNNKEAGAVTLEIPRNQVSGSADAMPMVALPFELTGPVSSYTNTEVGTLQFMNLGSIIKLNIFSSDASFQGETIENVTLQAGTACAGSFTYDITALDEANPAAISGYEETDVVVSGDGAHPTTVGVDRDHGGVFYVIVAPGTYAGSFKIRTSRAEYIYNSASRTYSRASVKPLNIDLAGTNWTAVTGYDNTIDSPRELYEFLAGTSSSDTGSYTITADLDMTGYTITSASGFGGTLEGNDHKISNVVSSVPLFETNNGTIRNLILDETCSFSPSSNKFGALVREDKGGVYESVKSAASVIYTPSDNITTCTMIGGLVGFADVSGGPTFTSCSNSGQVKLEAPGYYHVTLAMGGLVGYAKEVTFTSCTNSGPVTVNAWYGDPAVDDSIVDLIGIGGLIGFIYSSSSSSSLITCENKAQGVVTLNHTDLYQLETGSAAYSVAVGGVCGYGTVNMNKANNYAPINVSCKSANGNAQKIKKYILKCGGVIGVVGSNSGLQSCKNEGAITVDYDGSYRGDANNVNCAAVGGIFGSVGYNNSSQINYCDSKAPISVAGKGKVCVGGIGGINGKLIRDRFFGGASITISVAESYVGGIWGQVSQNGSGAYAQAKGCKVEASITNTTSGWSSMGGLLGLWNAGNTGNNVFFISYDGEQSSFSGTISAPLSNASGVGFLIGETAGDSQTKNFGKSDDKILASGSIERNGLSLTQITSSNIETYWYGKKKGTNNIYVEAPEEVSPSSLTLMSFNIREGSNWTSRRGPIVSMINGESPDLIGLQEVKDLDVYDLATQGKHPWNYLKDNLSAYSGYRSGTYHNAILYKTSTVELSNTGIFFLRDDYNTSGNSWDGYERTALYATVREKATGRYFFYITTHFPMNDSNDGWNKSTALLENRIAALNTNNYPVILMGDFNCVIGNACWDNIKTWMKNTRYNADTIVSDENRDLYTYNAFGDSSKARNKVDHIWVSKNGINVDSYVTLTTAVHNYGGYTTNGETFLSDHYPIIAHIS